MQIYDENGNKVSMDSIGLVGLKLHVPSPSFEHEMDSADGLPGEVLIDRKLKPRELTAELWTKSESYEESFKQRDILYGFLASQVYIYVGDVEGKRWKVLMNDWDLERVNSFHQSMSLPLTAPTGTAESTNVMTRSYTDGFFNYRNEGTFGIDMRHQGETEIEFKGASSGLSIKNVTTGDEWVYNESTTEDDTILLKGVRSLKNGESIFGQTNRKLISLAVGNNKFEITGSTGAFELIIRTRFYFL